MSSTPLLLLEGNRAQSVAAGRLVFFSIVFHVVVFLGVPLAISIAGKSKKFERPATFELVRIRPPLPPQSRPRSKTAPDVQKPRTAETKPVPSKSREAKPDRAEESRPEENIDDLASLLQELPSPMQVAAEGDFKYPWYLLNVQQKAERYWNPPGENRDIAVVVSFTIFGDGNISEVVMEKSSGNESLDNLALRAIKLAAPFGKLPPGFSENRLEIHCTLRPVRR